MDETIDEQNKSTAPADTPSVDDYISGMKEIKENSVSKKEYEKLKEENKKLIQAIVDGTVPDELKSNVAENQISADDKIKEIRSKLFDEESQMSNLEYIQNALNLRKLLMEKGEVDPFVPVGKKITPTKDDFDDAERVAGIFQEIVDYANGDPEIFTDELKRRLN